MKMSEMHPCEGCPRNCEEPCWKVEHGLLVEACEFSEAETNCLDQIRALYDAFYEAQAVLTKQLESLTDSVLQLRRAAAEENQNKP